MVIVHTPKPEPAPNPSLHQAWGILYAESEDGINFVKPALGRVNMSEYLVGTLDGQDPPNPSSELPGGSRPHPHHALEP